MKAWFSVPFVMGMPRPRFGNGHAYTPSKAKKAMDAIKAAFIGAGGIKAPKGVPVTLTITTYRDMPKTTPKRFESIPDVVKPDLDNVQKLVMDALNGTAWHDDAQVNRFVGGKGDRMRGHGPVTYIGIMWGEDE